MRTFRGHWTLHMRAIYGKTSVQCIAMGYLACIYVCLIHFSQKISQLVAPKLVRAPKGVFWPNKGFLGPSGAPNEGPLGPK